MSFTPNLKCMPAFSRSLVNVVLLGKTGEGKSTTGNTLLSCNKFNSSNKKGSCTKEPKIECFERDGLIYNIVDTPGLCDTKDKSETTLNNIYSAMGFCEEGFNALLLVFSYTSRCTAEDLKTMKILKASFGQSFVDHCIIVFTHGANFDMDNQDSKMSFEDWCNEQTDPPELQELFQECKHRVVLVYNKVNQGAEFKKEESSMRLLQMIRQMPGRYCNEDFEKAKIEREKLLMKEKLPELKRNIQVRLSLLENEIVKALDDIDNFSSVDETNLMSKVEHLLSEIKTEDKNTNSLEELYNKTLQMKERVDRLSPIKEKRIQQLQQIRNEVHEMKNPPSAAGVWFRYLGGLAAQGLTGALAVAAAATPVGTVAMTASLACAAVNMVGTAKGLLDHHKEVQEYNANKK